MIRLHGSWGTFWRSIELCDRPLVLIVIRVSLHPMVDEGIA